MAGDIVSNAKGLLANRSVMLGISVAGIVGSLLVYGVLQERLMTQPFFTKEGSEEKFKYSVFIVRLTKSRSFQINCRNCEKNYMLISILI